MDCPLYGRQSTTLSSVRMESSSQTKSTKSHFFLTCGRNKKELVHLADRKKNMDFNQGCLLSSTSKFPDFSLIFPGHFTVFHTLWQIKKSYSLLFMVLTVSLQIWGLLLKKRIWEQIPPFKGSP